ncbi:MAG TPA: alpha/beta hydrolase [Chitinophagaceae bacterium]|nr:alpha/beta hydrolase [Chitinophagaceae bacterium]
MKAYFISGLGADKKAFQKIKLPAGYEPVYLDWITPEKNESLSNYALRFSSLIKNDDAFVLIGLSFGGMLACEIARLRKPLKTIIISSIGASNELPWYFKRAGRIGLHKAVPIKLLKAGTIFKNLMGAASKADKAIIINYAKFADPVLVRWSLDAIVNWDQPERLPGIIHLHGSNDHMLPIKYTRPDFVIKNGGHLMVFNKADEVNKILNEVLLVN